MSEKKIFTYALIDAAVEEDFFELVKTYELKSMCLYDPSLNEEIIRLAPYLVNVTPELKTYLDLQREKAWGVYLFSTQKLTQLAQHLRHFIYVELPEKADPFYFRFYDPRVIWHFISIVSPETLRWFLGWVQRIETVYGEPKSRDFMLLHTQLPYEVVQSNSLLTFSHEEFATFNAIFSQDSLFKLKAKIMTVLRQKNVEYACQPDDYSTDLFSFFDEQKITDGRVIFGFVDLLIEKEIYCFADIPESWLAQITGGDVNFAAHRLTLLIIDELGNLPVQS